MTDDHGQPPAQGDVRLLDEPAAAYLASVEEDEVSMARIAVRPTWVSLLDFERRLPGALGGLVGAGR